MNVLLMSPASDFDIKSANLPHERDLVSDLGLGVVFQEMSGGDEFLRRVSERALLTSARDVNVIAYRQAVLADAIANPTVFRSLYALATDTLDKQKRHFFYGISARRPSSVVRESVEVLLLLVEMLRQLRTETDRHRNAFQSDGMRAFADRLADQLSDTYLLTLVDHLQTLRFRQGMLVSASLDWSLKGTHYTLRHQSEKSRRWMLSIGRKKSSRMTFHIADRDEAGFRALSELEDRAVNDVANALAQSRDHVVGFFAQLRTELAFYVACLNLYERITQDGQDICFPSPQPSDQLRLSCRSLRDLGLLLSRQRDVVANDLDADDKCLLVVTGANQGGKSTFLRSLGVAQLMMQCGMFVSAREFQANVAIGIYTHFKREEDAEMQRGKFDEELARMSQLVDRLNPGSLVCLNESFAATNEREGSDVASGIVRALIETGVKVVFVTHLHAFADEWYRSERPDTLFLRAERMPDGSRTFKMVEASPLDTSFGEDVYRTVFGDHAGVNSIG